MNNITETIESKRVICSLYLVLLIGWSTLFIHGRQRRIIVAAFNLLTVSICTGLFVCEYRDEF